MTRRDSDERTGTATDNRIPDRATMELDGPWDAESEKYLLQLALDRVEASTRDRQFQMVDLRALHALSAKETARSPRVCLNLELSETGPWHQQRRLAGFAFVVKLRF